MSTFDEAVHDIKNAKDAIDGLVANQNPDKAEMKHPDPKKHLYISLVKSFLRITAGITLAMAGFDPDLLSAWLKTSGAFFIAAEVLGIVEELV